MGFFDSIKAAFGLGGGADVTIKLSDEKHIRQGGQISGQVILRGGKVQQNLKNLIVEIQFKKNCEFCEEDPTALGKPGFEIIQSVLAAEAEIIRPDEEYVFDFQMNLSETAPISTEESKWRVWARADISGARDSLATLKFALKPSVAHKAFDKAMLNLGYRRDDISNDDETGGLNAEYMPLEEEDSLFSMIICDFLNKDGELQAALLLCFNDDNSGEKYRELLEKDEDFPTLLLPHSSIFPAGDLKHPDVNYVTAEIQKVFDIFK